MLIAIVLYRLENSTGGDVSFSSLLEFAVLKRFYLIQLSIFNDTE